jgi:hypothetical protein
MVNLADFGGPQFKPNEPGPGGHGQQGTLFSNRRLNAANRTGDEVGHKGFSPNRLNDVRSAVDVQVNGVDNPRTDAALSGIYTGAEVRGENPDGQSNRGYREAVATDMTRQQVHENIARSTVPMSTLMRHRPGTLSASGTQINVGQPANPGSAGSYSPMGGNIVVRPDFVEDSTVIHELGHQQDWHSQALVNLQAASERRSGGLFGRDAPEPPTMVPGERSGATTLGTPENFAKIEGFADAFADRHARPHPKAMADPSMPADPGGGYSRYRDNQWGSYAGSEESLPAEFGPVSQAYTEARRAHGGIDLRPQANMQQLQFGRHIQGVVDINDRSWEPALGMRAR